MPETIEIAPGHTYSIVTATDAPGPIGIVESHPDQRDPSKTCEGMLHFDTPWWRENWHRFVSGDNAEMGAVWRVESLEPLTLSPSVLCTLCGNHGFIRNGKWEAA
jgi:hypothetical protein